MQPTSIRWLLRGAIVSLVLSVVLGSPDAPRAALSAATRCVALGASGGCGPIAEARVIDGAAAIAQKARQAAEVLGRPIDSTPVPASGGLVQRYEFGAVYWRVDLGAFEVHGGIHLLYQLWGQQAGRLGFPTSDEAALVDGRISTFEDGAIFFHPDPAIGTQVVFGANFLKWAELALDGRHLGFPKGAPIVSQNGSVVGNEFQNGVIYWSFFSGAHEVHGAILDKWDSMGRDTSSLGLPTSDEVDLAGGGRMSRFQHGVILWSPQTGARSLTGDAYRHWDRLAERAGPLGLPISDVLPTADAGGSFVRFQHGAIYDNPVGGTFEVHGAIYDKWASTGLERGPLGYPMSDELFDPASGGQVSRFQHGSIRFDFDVDPLKVYTQNMAMTVYPMSLANCFGEGLTRAVDYCGFDKTEALNALKGVLRRERPDVVGLQEMFDDDAVSELLDPEITDMYPFSFHGPDGVGFESDGGLLLLSRLPVVTTDFTVFPVTAFPDSLAQKGVGHARILTESGTPYDVFVTHLQDKSGGNEAITISQVDTARFFVESQRGTKERPAIIMGDFNLNGNDAAQFAELVSRLGGPFDTWRSLHPGAPGQTRCGPFGSPADLCGLTSDRNSTFNAYGDPAGRERGVEGGRLDFIFGYDGAAKQSAVVESRILNEQTVRSVDMADHFGVITTFGGTQTLDVDYTGPVGEVYIRFHAFHTTMVTDGVLDVGSDDEVDWVLDAAVDGGPRSRARTRVEGISNGELHYFSPIDGPQLLLGGVESVLRIEVEGTEIDPSPFGNTGAASLGRRSIELTRSQLFEALQRPQYYTLAPMRGNTSEYFVTIEVSAWRSARPRSATDGPGPIDNPEGPQFN